MTIPRSPTQAPHTAVETNSFLNDVANTPCARRAQLRRYEVNALTSCGEMVQSRHIAPALPMFEDAFCAFTRGSLVETDQGPMAIEDLLPGDKIITGDGSTQVLLWKGSTVMVPGRPNARGRTHTLTRIMADTFGMQRPRSGVIAGHSARLLATPAHLRHLSLDKPILTPVHAFLDGTSVVETLPPTPVELFHLCLRRHALINVDGLQFETYHPGIGATRTVGQPLRDLYLSLFTHIDSLTDFGPQILPRAGDGEINAITA
ncbi:MULTISPECIES: Hint domain-containing protein [unclassified Ruegeria]|uniref:Hint domain-containing protein n=1 Tax=unclassified Ruegeria TaxID=2625375 RepID=UPI001489B857|nr:Hint domain-containing protein [Ruegeria sp. HKCCD8929]